MEDCDAELFVLYKRYRSGGEVWLMKGLERRKPDYDALLSIGRFLARMGCFVKILSPVHYKDPIYKKAFGLLTGTPYYRKCPDLMIDGLFYEYESYVRPFKVSNISHMIKHGLQQSDRIIIDKNKGASERYIVNMILRRLNDKSFQGRIEEVFVYEKGSVRRVFPIKKR